MKNIPYIAGLLIALSQPSFAVLPFLIETDANGDFLSGMGSYTGDGTVQSNVVAGNFNNDGTNNSMLVNDLLSGTLSFDTSVDHTRVSSTLAAQFNVSFTGGTGDLYMTNSSNFDGGVDKFNSVGLQDLGGVTAISVTISFNEHVAGRGADLNSLGSLSILAALGLVNEGTGLALSDFDVAMSYSDAYHSANGTDFIAGAPGAVSRASAGWQTVTGGGLDYTADGFAGNITDNDTNFLLVRGFDIDGQNGFDEQDAEKFYTKTQTWTITPKNVATFADDTAFTFSLDGTQYANIVNVPEVSVSMLSAFAGLMALSYRRRKNG